LELGAWSLELGAWSLELGAWSLELLCALYSTENSEEPRLELRTYAL
jgi:hypothetical protein